MQPASSHDFLLLKISHRIILGGGEDDDGVVDGDDVVAFVF